jgi:glycosyltransferase involved in cell wall biosynthesis
VTGRSVPAVTVVIPAKDAASTLGRALAGVAGQDVDHEVIVVDDGSSDATPAVAREHGVRVVAGAGEGPAAARNLGAGAATARALAFLDADCFPTPGWLAAGLRALEDVELVQGAVRADPDAPRGPFDRTLWVTDAWGLFESANLFVRRDAFEALGGFEGWLGQATAKELAEDTWLGWRARRAGMRTAFAPEALVHHAVFARGARGYVAERARLRYFPALARRIPELRESLFVGRTFLNRRSASFDLALAGAAAAAVKRRPAPLAVAAPYAVLAVRDAHRWGRRFAAANAVADAVGAAALAYGSARARSLLL